MPFEFNGEAPSFGSNSTSEAFTAFSFGSSPTTPAPQAPSFGSTPSFGGTSSFDATASFGSASISQASAFGGTPSFGSHSSLSGTGSGSFDNPPPASATPTSSKTGTTHPVEQRDDQPTTSLALAVLSKPKGPICRALHRAQIERPALFGKSEIEADKLVVGYLKQMSERDGCTRDESIEALLEPLLKIREEIPEGMEFLKYVFACATGAPIQTPKVAVESTNDAEVEKENNGEGIQGEEGAKTPRGERKRYEGVPGLEKVDIKNGEAPDFYDDIHFGTPLFNACMSAINNRMRGKSFYHYNSYYDIGSDVASMIARAAPRSVIRAFLASGAHGRFAPSNNAQKDIVDFTDEIYEIVLKVKKEFANGWKVMGVEDAEYFGKGRVHIQAQNSKLGKLVTYSDESKEPKQAYCCPRNPLYLRPRETNDQPFRFMNLPPELRNNVYKFLINPGEVCMFSCCHHMPQGTAPRLAPNILATSKVIHEEAKDLIYENKFLVTVSPDFPSKGRSALHKAQLPAHVLPRIKDLVLVIDFIRLSEFSNSDWTSVQDLTGLKTLRIVALEEVNYMVKKPFLANTLTEIITRIPADCEVVYGVRETWWEKKYVDRMLDELQRKYPPFEPDEKIGELDVVPKEDLEEASGSMGEDVVQGAKSGEKPIQRITPGTWKGGLPAGVRNIVDLGGLVMPAEWVKKKNIGDVEVFDREAESEIRKAWNVGED